MINREATALSVVNLSIVDVRSGATLVGPLTFELMPGECLAFVGDSGSGKSLTLRALMNMLPVGLVSECDEFYINGKDTHTLTQREWNFLRGSTIGFVQQDSGQALDPLKRVHSEVVEAQRVHRKGLDEPFRIQNRKAGALSLLEEAGVSDAGSLLERWPHQLSGGQRQRVLLAAARSAHPRILLADEPTTALDPSIQLQVLRSLKKQTADNGSLIIVSHDEQVIQELADRTVYLKNGKITSRCHVSKGSFIVMDSGSDERARSEDGHVPKAILEASKVSAQYPSGHGVVGVSLKLYPGRVLGVLGESGAGKSTLAKAIACVLPLKSGQVTLDEMPWSQLTEKSRRTERWRVQWVPQDSIASFARGMSVQGILEESLRAHPDHSGVRGASKKELSARAKQLLRRVGLEETFLSIKPKNLSGGQRQRVAIARALAGHPQVIICDEAVSALDATAKREILALFRSLVVSERCAMLFISHDVAAIEDISDEVLVMHEGKVIEHGAANSVLNEPTHRITRELLRDSGYFESTRDNNSSL